MLGFHEASLKYIPEIQNPSALDLLIFTGLVIITVITVDEDKSKQIIFQNFLPCRQENNSNKH